MIFLSKYRLVGFFMLVGLVSVTGVNAADTPLSSSFDASGKTQIETDNYLLYPIHDEFILPEIPDRIEGLNRATFAFNLFFEKTLLRPIARGYLFITPSFFRKAVSNLSNTLQRPVSAANALLQDDLNNFFDNFFAFTHNIFFGVFGLVDFYGSVAGRDIFEEDFNQTMAVYGIGYGSYLVLPILPPSSLRGAVGLYVDGSAYNAILQKTKANTKNPQHITNGVAIFTVLSILNSYAENLELIITAYETSLDPYVALRSFYYQSQLNNIYNGNVPDAQTPDLISDDEEDFLDDL